jgi:hypothetical protein
MQLNLNFPASLILLSFAALASASPIADGETSSAWFTLVGASVNLFVADKGTLSKRVGCNGSLPLLSKKIHALPWR